MGTLKTRTSPFWNLYALIYDFMRYNPPYQSLIKNVAVELDLDSQMILLDAGCGTGNLEYELTNHSRNKQIKIYAIDSSVSMLNLAKQKNASPEVLFSFNNLNQKLPFPENNFDRISVINVLYSVNNPEIVLRELFRILKPGGKVVIVNPGKKVDIQEFFKVIISSVEGSKKITLFFINIPLLLFNMIIALKAKKMMFHFWDKNQWIEVLTRVGYDKIRITPIYIQGYCITAHKNSTYVYQSSSSI